MIRLSLVALIGIGATSYVINTRKLAEYAGAQKISSEVQMMTSSPRLEDLRSETSVGRGANFSAVLEGMGIDTATAGKLIVAAQPVFSFRKVRQGNTVSLLKTPQGQLSSISYSIDHDHELRIIRQTNNEFRADVVELPSTSSTVVVNGKIESSLFESLIAAGEGPDLAVRLADIFAFDLDFYTDPQPGDTFRALLEKRKHSTGAISYGRIFAAEYKNGRKVYQAVMFKNERGQPVYYTPDGKSLQKAFLRSPLKFAARVSSHFSRNRYHPVLKIHRPHLGTDYAAPTGTPVQAVASGKVLSAARSGGSGNMVRIEHTNGYQTYYLHLSRILVRSGQRVDQGQRIGLVGMTGLASGPHLDFRVRRNGTFVNFEAMKLPPSGPVPQSQWAEFAAGRDKWMGMLQNGTGEAVQAASAPHSTPVQRP